MTLHEMKKEFFSADENFEWEIVSSQRIVTIPKIAVHMPGYSVRSHTHKCGYTRIIRAQHDEG